MRILRSAGACSSSTPLLVPFWPSCQRRNSRLAYSSIELPRSDLTVATTSWVPLLASNAASFARSCSRVPASRTPASSTTRPDSAGKSAVAGIATSLFWAKRCAGGRTSGSCSPLRTLMIESLAAVTPPEKPPLSSAAAGMAAATSNAMVAKMRRIAPVPFRNRLELDLRRALGLFGDGERLHRLVGLVERARPDHAGKRLEFGVVGLHRLDVVAPRDRNAVLGAFELRLQREKILVRFQLRIGFGDDEQTPERTGKLALRFLEFLERVGIE